MHLHLLVHSNTCILNDLAFSKKNQIFIIYSLHTLSGVTSGAHLRSFAPGAHISRLQRF